MSTYHATSAPSAAAPGTTSTPRFFYGWVMVPIATLAMMCTAPAQSFGISVFNPFFREDLALSRSALAGAYALGTFLACLPLAYVGSLMDRFGLRRTMTAVVLLFAAGCFLASQAVGLFSLFLAFFMLRLFGSSALGLLAQNTLPMWFNRRLGFVSAFKTAGMSLAIAAAPALHLFLIQTFGWRAAYQILGLAVCAILLPLLAFAFRNRPEDVGQRPDNLPPHPDPELDTSSDATHDPHADPAPNTHNNTHDAHDNEPAFTLRQAMRHRAYWIMAACTAAWAFSATAIHFCSTSLFAAHGLDPALVSHLFLAFGLTLGLAQFLTGFLADRIPLNLLLAAATLFFFTTLTLLRFLYTPSMIYLLGISMGLTQASLASVGATLWVRYYGRTHLGKIKGSLLTLMVASASLGPLLIESAYDLLGSYNTILTALMALPLPLTIAALFATPPRRTTSSTPPTTSNMAPLGSGTS